MTISSMLLDKIVDNYKNKSELNIFEHIFTCLNNFARA